MVGNDIIDLEKTRRASDWQRPGFLQKIFTPLEQSIIAAAEDPFTTVWQLWSMKESAYKIFIQAGGARFYNPSKLACHLISHTDGEVKMNSLLLKTTTLFHPDYLFTVAKLNNIEVTNAIFPLSSNNREQQSKQLYQQLIDDYALIQQLNPILLSIQKLTSGVPILHYNQEPILTAISITHHGKYGAYSFCNH